VEAVGYFGYGSGKMTAGKVTRIGVIHRLNIAVSSPLGLTIHFVVQSFPRDMLEPEMLSNLMCVTFVLLQLTNCL
jgi:hypothetical protein